MIWILEPLWSIGVLMVRVAVELIVPQAGLDVEDGWKVLRWS